MFSGGELVVGTRANVKTYEDLCFQVLAKRFFSYWHIIKHTRVRF